MNPLLAEMEARWQAMFAALQQGDDLPPTIRLRCEGLMEAAVLQGLASTTEIDIRMDTCYRQASGATLAEDFGAGWRNFYPFPQIPAVAQRAPVYPSTAD